MDARLLQLYEQELQHLREMGREFAQQHPKIAARLGMSTVEVGEVADPYVERLLEGVAFLAARVQLKVNAEFPRFTQALLEIIYPQYLTPTPAMVIAQLQPDPAEPNLANGFTIARGTTMLSTQSYEDSAPCEFKTAHDVTLWPIDVASASYFSFAPDLPISALPIASRVRGGLRIRLKTKLGLKFKQIAIDRLRVFLTGHDNVANGLHELCLGSGLGALVLPPKSPAPWHRFLGPRSLTPVGFADNEALLPVTLRGFQGYRLLQEYFAFPQRFRFFDLSGLRDAAQQCDGEELEVVILFSRADQTLDRSVDASNVALYCTPAVNLFEKRLDRIHVSESTHEYHVVPDRTKPMDFEVVQVTEVVGHGVGAESEREFRPFYAAYSADADRAHTAYFTTRREPRLMSSAQKRRGTRSSYIGTEVFLSLVDSAQAPFGDDLRQLSMQALCTNRDLVLLMPLGSGKSDLMLDVSAPVTSIRVISGPSRPSAPVVDGSVAWRGISHLSLNYLSLVDSPAQEGAASLRDLLDLYAPSADAAAHRQIEGIRSVQVARVVRRLPAAGPIAFGRGLEVTVKVDDQAFHGSSAFMLGAVLAHFFGRYVSINSFTETVLRSDNRGEINRWEPQWGARPTL